MFSIIAAIGKNNEIGKKGDLVFHLKGDMRFFRETTKGHTVVMGKTTWGSLPAKLKNRTNLVVSRDEVPGKPDGVITDLDQYIKDHQNSKERIFIIGGGSMYKAFLPDAKELYLTEIDATDPEADVFFPTFDKDKYEKTIIKKGTENGINYSIIKYIKN